MANRIQIQEALRLKYNRVLFAKEILSPIFGNGFSLHTSAVDVSQKPNQTEARVIQKVQVYGKIVLDDTTEVNCYEILLQPKVRIEQSKVAIQHYIRKMLTSGQAALINFASPTYENTWRLTLVAKDSVFTEKGVKEKTTHAKRFTFLLGPSETCKTAAERFEAISTEKQTSFDLLVKAFSVERLSTIFFNEYKKHYDFFVDYLANSNFKTSAFKNEDKAIRDFSKKLLGRIVFLYFVQKKGWMGASNAEYTDGDTNFMMNLFTASGGNETFYSVWLTKLFFDTLNTKERKDDFELPDGKKVKIPYLNGGLFDKEEHDDNILVFKPTLFHNPENADDPAQRGFLDFLNSFNFTVFEDSPEEHTIAVDPEMLGHIFENLLEDNKDKGAFYTPKEVVHYMCQESLTEYLATHLAKEYTLYKPLGSDQLEIFGNDARTGQLSIIEELGDKALNHEHVEHIVKAKDINGLSTQQLKRIDALLDSVKICDPAIGSGAFPMGLLQEIFAIKEVIAYQLDIPWQPATVKENIIQNSIYGVDIEKGAVDIARLRFWLSLVVDEDKPKALPNLDYKIVVGNSLLSKFENEIIEIDWGLANNSALKQSRPDLFKKFNTTTCTIIEKQKQYFSAEGNHKKEIAKEIRLAKIKLLQILFEVERQKLLEKGIQPDFAKNKKEATIITKRQIQYQHLQAVIKKLTDLKDNPLLPFNHFDWKLDFPEILNPFVAGISTESSEINVLNKQILAINAQIEAINEHINNINSNTKILKIQTKVATQQTSIINKQLDSIEKRINEIAGIINTINKNVVSEPVNIEYLINSLNSEINNINERIAQINPQINKTISESGFDVVIGNPPYIQLQKDSGMLAQMFEKSGFETFERTGDIYALFYEKGFQILKNEGIHTFVTSSQWMKAAYGKSLRKYFLKQNPLKLILLGPGVFENATVDTNILIARKGTYKKELKGLIIENGIALDSTNKFMDMPYVSETAWAIIDTLKQAIKSKIEKNGKQLKDWNVEIYRGVLTGYNEAFIIDQNKRDELVAKDPKLVEIIKPILRGRGIEKYITVWDGDYIIITFPSLNIDIEKYVVLKTYFEGFLPKIEQAGKEYINEFGRKDKTRKKTFNQWFETQDPIGYVDEFKKEKIVWKRIGSQLRFSYVQEEIFCLDSTCIATGEKIKYLTALLNSKLCNYQLFENSPKTGMGDLIISVQALEPLHVYYPNEKQENQIVSLVDKILEAKKANPAAETTDLEAEIDKLVYVLYELTPEEIEIIEGKLSIQV